MCFVRLYLIRQKILAILYSKEQKYYHSNGILLVTYQRVQMSTIRALMM